MTLGVAVRHSRLGILHPGCNREVAALLMQDRFHL